MSTTTATILVAGFGALFSVIGALALIIFNDMRRRVGQIERHIGSLLSAYTPLAMRNALLEEFLERELHYHPPDLTRYEPR